MTVIEIISLIILSISIPGIIIVLKNRCSKGGFHDWEYLGSWGITFQKKKCKKCNKLKIIDQ